MIVMWGYSQDKASSGLITMYALDVLGSHHAIKPVVVSKDGSVIAKGEGKAEGEDQ